MPISDVVLLRGCSHLAGFSTQRRRIGVELRSGHGEWRTYQLLALLLCAFQLVPGGCREARWLIAPAVSQ